MHYYKYCVVLQTEIDRYCVIREDTLDPNAWIPSKMIESYYEAHAYMEQWIKNDNQDDIDAYKAKRNNHAELFDDSIPFQENDMTTELITYNACRHCGSARSGFPYGPDESRHCMSCGSEWDPVKVTEEVEVQDDDDDDDYGEYDEEKYEPLEDWPDA